MTDVDLQALWQQLAALAAVALAAGWLTARWLIRRRRDCGGACSRCTGAGACEKAGTGVLPRTDPPRGVRSPGLRVVQPGPAPHPSPADSHFDENLSAPRDV